MRVLTLGVIAITSAMLLACTTETTTTESGGTQPAASKPDDPAGGWHSKLSLAKSISNASGIAALTGKGNPAPTLRTSPGGGTCGLSTGDPTCDSVPRCELLRGKHAGLRLRRRPQRAPHVRRRLYRRRACISACESAHPTGAKLLDTLTSCVETNCGASCGGPSGPPSGPPSTSACGFGSGDATCDTCLDTNCCTAASTCLGDADRNALLDCVGACTGRRVRVRMRNRAPDRQRGAECALDMRGHLVRRDLRRATFGTWTWAGHGRIPRIDERRSHLRHVPQRELLRADHDVLSVTRTAPRS